ncbi:hypothetical protein [Mumia sp. DW29H23]|uniref:hypothetical protein n=1 Tax=Mumia sp. DW29H23 TaxID=3421241 RepID=UPI003D699F36
MRRSGDVALRVAALLGVWVVLGRAVGLLAGDTPDATIASAVATTALWYATAGALALRDGRRGLRHPYPLWAIVGLVASILCVAWQWVANAVATGVVDLLLLRDDLVVLTPGLVVGAWACAGVGLALGRHDAVVRRRLSVSDRGAVAHLPLTTSAARAIHEVGPPRLSSRRSAAR